MKSSKLNAQSAKFWPKAAGAGFIPCRFGRDLKAADFTADNNDPVQDIDHRTVYASMILPF